MTRLRSQFGYLNRVEREGGIEKCKAENQDDIQNRTDRVGDAEYINHLSQPGRFPQLVNGLRKLQQS